MSETKITFAANGKDTSVLKRIAAGDKDAIQECIDKYGNMVWAVARKLNSNFEDAEDVSQDIFLSIWQNAARFDETIASEATFVSMIARRRVLDRMRIAYRRPQTDPIADGNDVFAATEVPINDRIDASRALIAMRSLRPEQKEMICLNIFGGLSHQEIATAKRMPIGTVKTHIRRGLAAVRAILKQRGPNNAQNVTCMLINGATLNIAVLL